ncbi:response regulator transcription factor [Chitinophaga sedimenti]|uniref:response regulator n=1 Tax=Chitinophaga sedimenti TaxID=2033606 RepID=UPI002006A7B5|nr:response regulator transcription factor [Chitinophaga sedimenti]MCK7555399.1 response regulator transcription factor [Chitinophaga sedimenti]
MKSDKTRILIADDHPIFLKGLQEVIEDAGNLRVMYKTYNGTDAINVALAGEFDIAILDIDMPGANGLQVAERILAQKPEVAIILLTMHKAKDAFLKALEIGVSGYVLKENAVVDIINAIAAVSRHQSYISPEMSSFLLKNKNRNRLDAASQLEQLTQSEKTILEKVALYKSTKEIADELYISEKTVSNHRMNIAKKLNLSGKNSLLRFAIENMEHL